MTLSGGAAPGPRAVRLAASACLLLIAYLSLVPADLEVRTSAPPGVEHAIAYAGTAALMVQAYPARSLLLVAGGLAAYSGLMELLQILSPGRHPGLDGVLWSSAGALAGAWGSAAVARVFRRRS